MVKWTFIALMFVLALGSVAAPARGDDLARGFADPPDSARLRGIWWWLNGNVTQEAITRDLHQMKAQGFGGALLYDGDGSNLRGHVQTPAGPPFSSPQWRALYRHALAEADRAGMELSLNIQSGCDLGGPLVTPERAAKKVTFSQTRITGPTDVRKLLPLPPRKLDFYRDIAVVAYRVAPSSQNPPLKRRPITNLVDKLSMRELGSFGPVPDGSKLLEDVAPLTGEEHCRSADVLDLSNKMDAAGVLRWQAPQGEWNVLRFGYTSTGAKVNLIARQSWDGLVLDHLDASALRWYWKEVVEPLIEDAGPLAGKTLKYVFTDSWECGGMNWTPRFRDEFRARRGYDLLPFLPVMAGKIVDNREVTNRFLADFRRTIGDCIAENHYLEMKKLAQRHGMGIHPESGGPHGAPIDSLQCLGISDIPMSEFWARAKTHRTKEESRFFMKQPASAAHTYGRRLVAAEGLTTIGPHWQERIWNNLRPSFDRAVCEGLNMLFWSVVTCVPEETGMPGHEYFACAHLNPHVTWWSKSHAFLAYINRCQYLLQKGLFVADACYYYGDHVPNFAQIKIANQAKVLPGYDYDVATEEVVLTRMAVENGRIVLPDGMSYRLLVLPERTNISLPVLRKIRELVRGGATVVGPRPKTATGLGDYPNCDDEVRAIAAELWGPSDARNATEHAFGRGRVIWGQTAREVLAEDGVQPDTEFRIENEEPQTHITGIDWIHRRDGQTDIYFVCNRRNSPRRVEGTFRVSGRQPELWDAITGEIHDADAFTQAGGRTSVPLDLPPYGSAFVVFRKSIPADRSGTGKRNQQIVAEVAEIAGPWEVSFDPRWGGPGKVVFDKLEDWTRRPEEGIRHFSGTAVYRKTFDLPAAARSRLQAGNKLFLDLGEVKELAEVKLNGRSLGVLWCPPWRVDISDIVKDKDNRLVIEVVNFWPNRIIGDIALPPEKRLTRTNIRIFKADSPLMPSGLLGPVRLNSLQ